MSKFSVIAFMAVGILLGYLFRGVKITWLQKLITFLIWSLLFLLGVEAGSDESVINSLPTIGMEAVIITAAAVLGSVICAKLLWNYLKREKNK
ncbi:LysO family transporter [Bacteroides propionicifaciens]|jgi:uncharacterized membrane protein YbjE (DUF340 family)|uniref:LysO family transporter n=1 Tax=Bacteroides propionicifaciens TaxID=392838 RepID=UPI0003635F55|nr:LysO family transporter [Bacteroides propionicifaciens]